MGGRQPVFPSTTFLTIRFRHSIKTFICFLALWSPLETSQLKFMNTSMKNLLLALISINLSSETSTYWESMQITFSHPLGFTLWSTIYASFILITLMLAKRFLKKWSGLPHPATVAFLHMPNGVAITRIADVYYESHTAAPPVWRVMGLLATA